MHFIYYKIFYRRNVFSLFLYIHLFIIVNRCSNSKQGAPVLVASNLLESSHERACALNSIIFRTKDHYHFHFITHCFLKVFIKLPPPPDSSSSWCCIVYYVLSMLWNGRFFFAQLKQDKVYSLVFYWL